MNRLGIAATALGLTSAGAAVLASQADTVRTSDTSRVAPAGSTKTATTIDGPIHLVADLSARKLSVMSGGSAIRTYSVAVGRSSKPTPLGNFSIRKILWNPAWSPPNSAVEKNKT